MVSLEFFIDKILPAALWPWGSTQPLTEMSTRNISWRVKAAGAYGWQPYHIHVSTVLKSGSLNLMEPSGPVQACNGTALPLPFWKRFYFWARMYFYVYFMFIRLYSNYWLVLIIELEGVYFVVRTKSVYKILIKSLFLKGNIFSRLTF